MSLQTTRLQRDKYNPKVICQICGYTGHSARACRRRVPKETSLAYGKIPYTTNSQKDKNRRQELKRQQRPLNQMEAVDDNDEQDHYSDEVINQGF